jgi:hypothetical protein
MRAAGRGIGLVARVIALITALIFLIIALAVLLVLLGANESNVVFQALTDAARFLVGPFDGLFSFRDAKLERAVNWGIAAFVWLIVGQLIAGLLRRGRPRGQGKRTARA